MAIFTVTNLNNDGAGSLREAIKDASAGDTVEIQVSGTIALTSQINVYDSDVAIEGNGITLDGQNATRIFNVGNVTGVKIDNIRFRNGKATVPQSGKGKGAGGAIRCASNSEIALSNCSFEGNSCEEWGGGAIRIVKRSILTLNHCSFVNNRSFALEHNSGGAIAAHGYCELDISDCTFEENHGITGGAINVGATWVKLRRSTFRNNDTDNYLESGLAGNDTYGYGMGGAIYTDGLGGTDSHGGGSPGKEALIEDCLFEGNRAFGKGGACFWFGYGANGETSIIRGCTFRNNTVKFDRRPNTPAKEKSQGGALRINDLPTKIDRCLFENNSCCDSHACHDEGGAIFAGRADSELTVLNSIFRKNSGTLGSAIATHNPTTLFHCTVADSETEAIYTNPGRVKGISLRGCIFKDTTSVSPALIDKNPGEINAQSCIEYPRACFGSSMNSDPMLDEECSPQDGSAAIGTCESFGVMTDYRGQTRGERADIGAICKG